MPIDNTHEDRVIDADVSEPSQHFSLFVTSTSGEPRSPAGFQSALCKLIRETRFKAAAHCRISGNQECGNVFLPQIDRSCRRILPRAFEVRTTTGCQPNIARTIGKRLVISWLSPRCSPLSSSILPLLEFSRRNGGPTSFFNRTFERHSAITSASDPRIMQLALKYVFRHKGHKDTELGGLFRPNGHNLRPFGLETALPPPKSLKNRNHLNGAHCAL